MFRTTLRSGAALGLDVDLFDAVAKKIGLTTERVESKFGDIIPGIQSGKYELGVSSFTINDERKGQSLMVSYFSAGTQWATQKGNPKGIKPDDACGKKIAVQKDTVQVDDIKGKSKKCTDAGKPAISIEEFVDQTAATAAVSTGKDDAMLADSPVCAYAVKKTNGQLELLGEIYDSAPYGAVVNKDQTAFAEVLRDALKALAADGTYKKVLSNWGVEAGALTVDGDPPAGMPHGHGLKPSRPCPCGIPAGGSPSTVSAPASTPQLLRTFLYVPSAASAFSASRSTSANAVWSLFTTAPYGAES